MRIKRSKRSRSAEHRLELLGAQGINKVWSIDFVQDAPFNDERFRVLTVVDNCTGPPGSKIYQWLLPGKPLNGVDATAELTRTCLIEECRPVQIPCDNGSEFIPNDMDSWAYYNDVMLDF